ncbi:MAG TPA: MFS transporter [Solirubrobacteraceae bacterium]
MPAELRRARAATMLLFAFTGALSATWSSRIPAVQDRLGLTPGTLAVAILGLEAGAIAGLPGGGALVARIGSRRSLALGYALAPAGLLAAGLAPSLAALVAAVALFAAANSVIDVAMNVQGIELERRYGRPILAGLHAGHPLGLFAGGLAATAAAAGGLAPGDHFAVVAALAVPLGIGASRALVAEPGSRDRVRLVRPRGPLLVLGLVAFCAFLLDGGAYNWSAVHLRGTLGASPGLAAAGFSAFALAVAAGRLRSDRLVARLGRARFVRLAALVAAAGAAVVVAAGQPAVGIAGWMLLGVGLAGIAPTVLGAAPALADVRPPVAIAAVTMIGYLGSFTGPPAIGAVAQATGLSAALALLVAAALAAGALAPRALRVTRED